MMKLMDFIEVLEKMVNSKTIYVKGGFGAPGNAKNKERYAKSDPKRAASINAASADTFFFDCAGCIKGALWGWTGDKNKTYGGAVYCSNGVPDKNENMIDCCYNVSTDFSKLEI
ncbi:unnamed protein product, partial [Cylicocyclus nassatus]